MKAFVQRGPPSKPWATWHGCPTWAAEQTLLPPCEAGPRSQQSSPWWRGGFLKHAWAGWQGCKESQRPRPHGLPNRVA